MNQTVSTYVVLPRRLESLRAPVVSLQTLRRAVSRAWKGSSAVQEIRHQRKRSK